MWELEPKTTIYFAPSKRASPFEVYSVKNKSLTCKLHKEKTIAWISHIASDQDRNLIAAAPELLAALQDLLSETILTYDNRHEIKAAIDAINKATGEVNEKQ